MVGPKNSFSNPPVAASQREIRRGMSSLSMTQSLPCGSTWMPVMNRMPEESQGPSSGRPPALPMARSGLPAFSKTFTWLSGSPVPT